MDTKHVATLFFFFFICTYIKQGNKTIIILRVPCFCVFITYLHCIKIRTRRENEITISFSKKGIELICVILKDLSTSFFHTTATDEIYVTRVQEIYKDYMKF